MFRFSALFVSVTAISEGCPQLYAPIGIQQPVVLANQVITDGSTNKANSSLHRSEEVDRRGGGLQTEIKEESKLSALVDAFIPLQVTSC